MLRSTTLALLRSLLLLCIVVYIVVTQVPAMALHLRAARRLPHLWHLMCRRIIGMDVRVYGTPLADGPVLYVSNHTSYLDITALGSVVCGSFVARGDLRDWPVFGYLATLQRTIFIDRRPRLARQHMQALKSRLADGDSLILFPEGTSSDGNAVLPFKSTLFSVAEVTVGGRHVRVQPISIAYTRLDGVPMGRLLRPIYAWYGDMGFASHFWHLLGFGRFQVEMTFHEPVTIDAFASRKELAQYCERVIVRGFSRLLAGRTAPAPPAAAIAAQASA